MLVGQDLLCNLLADGFNWTSKLQSPLILGLILPDIEHCRKWTNKGMHMYMNNSADIYMHFLHVIKF